LIALLIPACSPDFPPAGIALREGALEIRYKLCEPRVVGDLGISRASDGTSIWSAHLVDPKLGTTSLAITDQIAGYEVSGSFDPSQRPTARFSLSANDQRDVNIESGFSFSLQSLREGMILDRKGRLHDLSDWLGRVKCR